MTLVFVHGINNQDNSAERIAADWWTAIRDSADTLGLEVDAPDIIAPFYGRLLADAVAGDGRGAVAMGGLDEEARRQAILLAEELAELVGVGDDAIFDEQRTLSEDDLVEAGLPHDRRLIAIVRAIQRRLPSGGRAFIKLFLEQAAGYLYNPVIRRAVLDRVYDQLPAPDTPCVIVAHSLGTAVTYELLREHAARGRAVKTFITLGSPLGLKAFKRHLPPLTAFPNPPIAQWTNGRHRDDFITMGLPLDRRAVGYDGVVDLVDIPNDGEDKHAVDAYLRAPDVTRAIVGALRR